MLTITAIIGVKTGTEQAMRDALLVADNVRLNEPQMIGFFVSQGAAAPCLFTTYERFADQAAMGLALPFTHNLRDPGCPCRGRSLRTGS